MAEPTMTCPHCGNAIRLTEALAAPYIEADRRRVQAEAAQRDLAMAKREAAIVQAQERLALEQAAIEERVSATLRSERAVVIEAEGRKARALVLEETTRRNQELEELRGLVSAKDVKLAEAQKVEAENRRKQRELDDRLREADLVVEKRVATLMAGIREQALKEAQEGQRLDLAAKDKTISDLTVRLQDAIRTAEQRSQQLQGEIQELDIEATLRTHFPHDTISPVPKGEFGGDALQEVRRPDGTCCGIILWESKRTRKWNQAWLGKLRSDQLTAKADLGVIASEILPDGMAAFGEVERIWVVGLPMIVPLAVVLRQMLMAVFDAQRTGEGLQTKADMVYRYMTGSSFRQRIQTIIEVFSTMRTDLDRERKLLTKQWSKREIQLTRVLEATMGLYGDLQGIAGSSLLEIKGLDLALLGSDEAATEGEDEPGRSPPAIGR